MSDLFVTDQLSTANYVIGRDGQPIAVIIDIATWQQVLARLEETEDFAIFRNAQSDLQKLAQGIMPLGWRQWEDFEAELDMLN